MDQQGTKKAAPKQMNGEWALVTGASSGMGADFAQALAAQGYNLLITARREDVLRDMKTRIEGAHPACRVDLCAGDLTDPAFRRTLMASLAGRPLAVLVNNAGFGPYGEFDQMPDATEAQLIALNIGALTHLTREAAALMKPRKKGFILETASIAAFQPSPLYAVYGATKAYVLSYGLAVRQELKGSGIGVTVLCPGVTKTAFFEVGGQEKLAPFQTRSMLDSATVVNGALKALFRGKAVYVPGMGNRVNAFLTRLISRPAAADIARSMLRA